MSCVATTHEGDVARSSQRIDTVGSGWRVIVLNTVLTDSATATGGSSSYASAARFSARLDQLIGACLTKDPQERFQSAQDVATELRWIATSSTAGKQEEGLKKSWALYGVVAALLLILLAGVVGYWWSAHNAVAPPSFGFPLVHCFWLLMMARLWQNATKKLSGCHVFDHRARKERRCRCAGG